MKCKPNHSQTQLTKFGLFCVACVVKKHTQEVKHTQYLIIQYDIIENA